MNLTIPIALTIAGSDPGGGAGIQADLKTFHRFGLFGTSVLTLVTVQNTRTVERVDLLEPDFVLAQLASLLADLEPRAAKTGALGSARNVSAVARAARDFRFPLVVDPVAVSKHGSPLLDREGIQALREELLPVARLVTPNLPEAEALSGAPVRTVAEMEAAARTIARSGVGAVLVKGGHLPQGDAIDVLYSAGELLHFRAPRIATRHTHGTGCTYSAAIVSGLAMGLSLPESVGMAKNFVTRAIAANPGLGSGSGPLNHWV